MKEKKAPKVKNADRLAATSARCRSAAPGTSGDCDRRSTATNPMSSSPATANSDRVEADVQPWFDAVCELWDDAALYERVASRARQIAEERYGEGVARQRHVSYFTSLGSRGRPFA